MATIIGSSSTSTIPSSEDLAAAQQSVGQQIADDTAAVSQQAQDELADIEDATLADKIEINAACDVNAKFDAAFSHILAIEDTIAQKCQLIGSLGAPAVGSPQEIFNMAMGKFKTSMPSFPIPSIDAEFDAGVELDFSAFSGEMLTMVDAEVGMRADFGASMSGFGASVAAYVESPSLTTAAGVVASVQTPGFSAFGSFGAGAGVTMDSVVPGTAQGFVDLQASLDISAGGLSTSVTAGSLVDFDTHLESFTSLTVNAGAQLQVSAGISARASAFMTATMEAKQGKLTGGCFIAASI